MADKEHLILTAIGPDRVGLVEKISEFISLHGCNIEDSKMAVFCGEFAVIVLISGTGGGLVKLARDYREIETETGLSISIKTPSARKTGDFSLPYKLTASCMDTEPPRDATSTAGAEVAVPSLTVNDAVFSLWKGHRAT
jgi:glycine cleavage system transcriptional repressor